MADTVRAILEEMIPELEDFKRRGYFSRPEIQHIVKKRTDFEYRLKRRAAVKADYLRSGFVLDEQVMSATECTPPADLRYMCSCYM